METKDERGKKQQQQFNFEVCFKLITHYYQWTIISLMSERYIYIHIMRDYFNGDKICY